MEFEVFCEYQDFAHQLNIYIFEIKPDGGRGICTSIDKMTFKSYIDGEMLDPTLSLKGFMARAFLQGMVNAAKKVGISPEGEPILENELVAVKYHLEDMRKLVFKKENK